MSIRAIATVDALRDLAGNVCACGKAKAPRKSHCSKCYFKLPVVMRKALYRRMGKGYEQAYAESLAALGHESPAVKARGGSR